MPTLDDIIAQREAVEAQRLAISSEIERLNQVAQRDPRFAFKDLHQKAKDDLNHAVFPLKDKIRVLHDQGAALDRAYRETARQQKAAEQAPVLAQRAAAAQQRAQSAARKEAGDNLENATARAFGLGPKKGINYILDQGAFYDPEKRQIAVPSTSAAKVAADKAKKGDAEAGKQVQAELSGFAKGAGVQGTVNPASFFGDNGFEMEPDEKGNYVYDANGTQVTIPQETAKRLQEQYNRSLAPVPEAAQLPTTGVKYIPVDTYQQARGALEQIKGPSGEPDPVEYQLARENRNYLAQPAIAAAISNPRADVGGMGGNYLNPARAFNSPRPIPATTIAGQSIPEVIPDRSTTVPSVEPGRDIPNLKSAAEQAPINAMSYLNSGVNPIFAQIEAKRRASAEAPVAVSKGMDGILSPDEVKGATSEVIDELGPDATQEQIGLATKARLEKLASARTPEVGNMAYIKKGADYVADRLNSLDAVASPGPALKNMIGRGVDYLMPRGLGDVLDAYPVDRTLPQKRADLEKRFAIDVGTGAIPKSTKQEDYVNFFLNGPQPTNLDSARYVPPTE